MSQDQAILLTFKVILIINEVAIISFIGIYTKLAKWWQNVIGRSIVILDGLLGLAFVPTILSLFFHFSRLSSVIAAWIDVGLFTLIAGTMISRCLTWIRIHRKGQEEESVQQLATPEDVVVSGADDVARWENEGGAHDAAAL